VQSSKGLAAIPAIAALLLAALPAALAGPPEAPWQTQDIGAPLVKGFTDIDATGRWTLKGSGDDIFGNADNFQFAYQSVRGDASLSARFLSLSGPNPEWTKVGLMIRENGAPGSPNLNYTMTSGHGLHTTARYWPNEHTGNLLIVGPSNSRRNNLYMRLQRVGQEIAGFYSADGQIWTQAGFSPQTLPTLKEEALIGLAVTSHADGSVATGRYDNVQLQPGVVSAYGIEAIAGDRSVTLQWRPLPNAVGFRLYRGPANATAEQYVKLAENLVAGTTYTDTSAGLENGTAASYLIVPVFRGADGQETEGLRVAITAVPIAAPPGFAGTSINESTRRGSAAFDPATGEITMRGSGTDIWVAGDQCYFLHRLVEGDFQITVKALSKPTSTGPWASAGLMLRDSLSGSARNATLLLTSGNGLVFQQRGTESGETFFLFPPALSSRELKTPITIRMTRRGQTVISEYSTDEGQSFLPAADPLTFDQELPRALSVGLVVGAVNPDQTTTARFASLTVQPLQ
jgi:hypothetical protein